MRYGTALALLLAGSAVAAAQGTPAAGVPKRTPLPAVILPVCRVDRTTLAAATDEQRRQARDFVSRADQAAILGDTTAALANLRRARAIDASDPDLAYRLARLYETGAAADSAVKEYCRFLSLAPTSPDAADARERVGALAKPSNDPAVDSANVHLQQGLRAYDQARMHDAELEFSRAITLQPAWADAYFDRALARELQGDRDQAMSDFEVYARLKPAADDRQAVNARIASLRRVTYSPGQAFALGLIIPGAGQFYTRRAGWGITLLAATGGAIGYALAEQTKITTKQQTATDPFGNPYTYTATLQGKERPGLVPGLAAAGALDLIGAIEAAVFAHQRNAQRPASRVTVRLVPSANAVGLRLRF